MKYKLEIILHKIKQKMGLKREMIGEFYHYAWLRQFRFQEKRKGKIRYESFRRQWSSEKVSAKLKGSSQAQVGFWKSPHIKQEWMGSRTSNITSHWLGPMGTMSMVWVVNDPELSQTRPPHKSSTSSNRSS